MSKCLIKPLKTESHLIIATQAVGWQMLNILRLRLLDSLKAWSCVRLIYIVIDGYSLQAYPSSEMVSPYVSEIFSNRKKTQQKIKSIKYSPVFSSSVL